MAATYSETQNKYFERNEAKVEMRVMTVKQYE